MEFKGSSSLDVMVAALCGGVDIPAKESAILGLNAGRIESQGCKVVKVSDSEYHINSARNNISLRRMARMLKSSNLNIYDVDYPDDIDENSLIEISEDPLWELEQLRKGVFLLKLVR